MQADIETRRTQRGTKRTCKSCEGRFYDLGRDPTVCPMCRSSLPMAAFMSVPAPSRTSHSGSWSRTIVPKAPLPIVDAIAEVPDEEVPADEASVEAAVPDADAILESEDEADGDVSELVLPDDEANPDE